MIAGVDDRRKVSCEELFAPVIGVYEFSDTFEARDHAGASEFGLQAVLFTMVNDVATFRVDHMPYGGVKRSGFGREGLRYAIEEMTELKLLTFNPRPL